MIITCRKYQFALPPEPNERNYFSLENRTLIETIDLADYLTKDGLGTLRYAESKQDESNSQYIESGSFDIEVMNTIAGWGNLGEYINSDKLTDFFELNNFVEQFVFFVEIRESESSEILWAGVVRKEGIIFPKRNNEVLNITVLSLDKEFAEYYSSKNLVSFDNFPIVNMTFNLTGLRWTTLDWVFLKNFPNVNFTFTTPTFISDYRVAERGYFYAPLPDVLTRAGSTLSIMAGYEQFYLDNLDRYTYFNSIMLGMGWRWFFKGDTMYIQRRYDANNSITTLDFEDSFIGHGYSIQVENARKQVAVYGGEIYGARNQIIDTTSTVMNVQFTPSPYSTAAYYYLGGHAWHMFKEGQVMNNRHHPYSELNRIGSIYNVLHNGENITVADRAEEKGGQEGKLAMKTMNTVVYQGTILDDITTDVYSDAETVYIKPYRVSTANGFHLDLTQASSTNNQFYGLGNAYNGAQDAGNNGMYCLGTPATGLLRLNESTLLYDDYQHYVNSPEFRNNMKTYTGGSDKLVINATVSGIYNSVGARYEINNYPYAAIGGIVFIAESVEVDLLNNVTNLKLISV